MKKVDRRSALVIGLAAASAAMVKPAAAETADPLAGKDTSPAPGVVQRAHLRMAVRHRCAGARHLGELDQRLGHRDRPPGHPPRPRERFLFVRVDDDSELRREGVRNHPTDVVAAACVFGAGIAETDD